MLIQFVKLALPIRLICLAVKDALDPINVIKILIPYITETRLRSEGHATKYLTNI